MICDECKKNLASVFINETNNGETKRKAYCYSCAKKHGLDPLSSFGIDTSKYTDDELNEMMKNFSSTAEMLEKLYDPKNITQFSELMQGFNLDKLNKKINKNVDNKDDKKSSGNINITINKKKLNEDDNDDEDDDEINQSLGQFSINNLTEELKNEMLKLFSKNDEDSDDEDDDEKSKFTPQIFSFPLSINNNDLGSDPYDNQEESDEGSNVRTKTRTKKQKNKMLDTFGVNLTQKALNGEVDNVIGREKEINRVIQILNRRTKNNPCLIGEPGVGKTAIAQGLALKIVQNEVPVKLLNKEIYLLDMTAIVAGTQYRGQFESRMKSIIKEVKRSKNIILVIDELQNIIGAGDGDHSMNAANILKPSLADGSLQLIGTTTLTEYRKYIEKDTALERRFQPVMVEEPSVEDSIEIIKGIKEYYEQYHTVKISNDIIDKLVKMSEKYIHDRFLPDKAIDVLDEACSRINLDNKELATLEILNKQLEEVKSEKELAAEENCADGYKKAAELKTIECNLEEQIQNISKNMKAKELQLEDIAKVIEAWTKIPVKKITEEETNKLLNLETNLHKRIIGQNEAVETVSKTIRRTRAGLKTTKKPPSFIFVGPTGVGKTELAKSLAYEMFGSVDDIIRIDMSEYMESNSSAKLIGAPPGYVGYDDAGQLTEKVKRHPYSIVLFDEIEKAHKDVFNILLQILDDGRLTDAQGNTVNFSNTIIIMTSNIGSDKNLNTIGFGSEKNQREEKIREALKENFRPEFLNRIDNIVLFQSLTDTELKSILELMLNETKKVLKDKNITILLDDDVKNYILKKGTNIVYGARPLRRSVEKYLEDELAELILSSKLKNGDSVKVTLNKDKLEFEVLTVL